MLIVWGFRSAGFIVFPGCRVSTKFFHVFFIPLIPIEGHLSIELQKWGFSGISMLSVLLAWLRTALIFTILFIATGPMGLPSPVVTALMVVGLVLLAISYTPYWLPQSLRGRVAATTGGGGYGYSAEMMKRFGLREPIEPSAYSKKSVHEALRWDTPYGHNKEVLEQIAASEPRVVECIDPEVDPRPPYLLNIRELPGAGHFAFTPWLQRPPHGFFEQLLDRTPGNEQPSRIDGAPGRLGIVLLSDCLVARYPDGLLEIPRSRIARVVEDTRVGKKDGQAIARYELSVELDDGSRHLIARMTDLPGRHLRPDSENRAIVRGLAAWINDWASKRG